MRDLKETGQPPASADEEMVRGAGDHRSLVGQQRNKDRLGRDALAEATAAMVRKACLEAGGELVG